MRDVPTILFLLIVAVYVARLYVRGSKADRADEVERRRLLDEALSHPIECQAPDPAVERFFWTTTDNLA